MNLLSLIDSTVLGLATLVVLILIAALLAWLVGFLYAKQQRFQDDLLVTLQTAGIGSDIRLKKRAALQLQQGKDTPIITARDIEQRRPNRLDLALQAWAIKLASSFRRIRPTIIKTARITIFLAVLGGTGYTATTFYTIHRTGIQHRLHQASDIGNSLSQSATQFGQRLIAQINSAAPTASADTVSASGIDVATAPTTAGSAAAAATSSASITSSLRSDTSLGITVSYPINWQINPTSSASRLSLTPKQTAISSGPVTITIDREVNSAKLSLDQWVERSFTTTARTTSASSMVGSWPAVQLHTSQSGIQNSYTVFGIVTNTTVASSQIYTATISAPTSLSATDPTYLAATLIVASLTSVLPTTSK